MLDISIVVTVYNKERYLQNCLQSVFAQEGINYEVLIIDDCSTDTSFEIIQSFQKKYRDKCRIIRNSCNIGLGSSRYVGVKESRGRYVTFIDADDYINTDFCKKMTKKLQEQEYDIIYGGYVFEELIDYQDKVIFLFEI